MQISAMIFDLGGVLCDIDFSLTDQVLRRLGVEDNFFANNSQLLDQFECGDVSPAEFLQKLKQQLPHAVSDTALLDAINCMLLGIPKKRLAMLVALREQYPIFLLSNTNILHIECVNKMLQHEYHLDGLDDLFDKAYYSYSIRCRKPDAKSFQTVINEQGLDPRATVFVDDIMDNLKAAQQQQLQTLHVPPGSEVCDLLPSILV